MSEDGLLQKLHAPIDIEVVELLLSAAPRTWWSVVLDVESLDAPGSDDGFMISISSEEGDDLLSTLPEKIYELLRRHFEIFEKYGRPWKRIRYVVRYDEPQEKWNYTIDYEY